MYAILSNWCRQETVNSETVDRLTAPYSAASHYCKSTQLVKYRVVFIEKQQRNVVSADRNCSLNVHVESKTMIISVFFFFFQKEQPLTVMC